MSQLSVLVISCDHYADLWSPFFSLFWKYWPDCPYPVYLGANKKVFTHPRVRMALVGPDISWAHSAQRMMETVPGEYVLVLLEDFLMRQRIMSPHVGSLLQALIELEGGYLRLRPFPKPDQKVPAYSSIGLIKPGAPYRAALQAAIWKKDVFVRLLEPGETPWQMELRGSARSVWLSEPFYSVWRPVMDYRAGVTLGKWTSSAIRLLRSENIPLDFTGRQAMTYSEVLSRKFSRLYSGLINLFPWQWRRRARDLMRHYILQLTHEAQE
jgi:hypothetical protein